MDRRRFHIAAAAAGLAATAGPTRLPQAAISGGNPAADCRWRRFGIPYTIELAGASGTKRPTPLRVPVAQTASCYQRAHAPSCSSTVARAALVHDPVYGAGMLRTDWNGAGPQAVELAQIVETRDRLPNDRTERPAIPAELRLYRQATPSMPAGGIVQEAAMRIVAGIGAAEARLRAINDWVVNTSFRDAAVGGCGLGNIATMLKTRYLGGKCAHINEFIVGLARAAGLPAREVYRIRVADSRLARSLGHSSGISKVQHCRAAVHLDGQGWFVVDPADVRKVILEEGLFGSLEMNWIGDNSARDFQQSDAPRSMDFLLYPYAFTAGSNPDCLDPVTVRYGITAGELPA